MECLVIGCPGVGKSTLLERLSCEDPTIDRTLPTLTPTVGSNVKDITLSKRKCVRLREVSGSLRQTWSQYYQEARVIIFLVDLTNRSQFCTSQVELIKLLNNPIAQTVPVLLLFTKCCSPLAEDLTRIYNIFDFSGILNSSSTSIKVLEVDLSEQSSVESILSWVREKYNVK